MFSLGYGLVCYLLLKDFNSSVGIDVVSSGAEDDECNQEGREEQHECYLDADLNNACFHGMGIKTTATIRSLQGAP